MDQAIIDEFINAFSYNISNQYLAGFLGSVNDDEKICSLGIILIHPEHDLINCNKNVYFKTLD